MKRYDDKVCSKKASLIFSFSRAALISVALLMGCAPDEQEGLDSDGLLNARDVTDEDAAEDAADEAAANDLANESADNGEWFGEDDFDELTAIESRVRWVPFLLTFTAAGTPGWQSFPLKVIFTHSSGKTLALEGFWDGGKTWRVRFAPTETGTWRWRSASSDSGLNGKTGTFSVRAPTSSQVASNPNLRGHLGVAANHRTFKRADDTSFFYMGDTGWFQEKASYGEVTKWADDRKAKGFTVLQITYATPSSANEGGYPYSSTRGSASIGNYSQINPGYFQSLDRRMLYMFNRGFVIAGHPDWLIASNRGYDLTEAKNISRYLLARYGAYPLVWSLTGEYELGNAYWSAGTFSRVDQLGTAMKAKNVFHHPMSVHPGGDESHGSSATHFHDEAWLDHNWLQSYNSPQRIPELISQALARSPAKPVILAEGQYEAIAVKNTSADLERRQAWVSYLSGAAGWVYGAHGVFDFSDMRKLSLPGSQDMARVARFFRNNAIPLKSLDPKIAAGRGCVKVNSSEPKLLDQTQARCAGIAGKVLVLYAPAGSANHTLTMRGLAHKSYRARWYDPSTGAVTDINGGNRINTDLDDTWTVPGRPSSGDWVLWLSN